MIEFVLTIQIGSLLLCRKQSIPKSLPLLTIREWSSLHIAFDWFADYFEIAACG